MVGDRRIDENVASKASIAAITAPIGTLNLRQERIGLLLTSGSGANAASLAGR